MCGVQCDLMKFPTPHPTLAAAAAPQNAVPTPKYTKVADGLVIKKVSKNDSGEYTCKAYQVSTTISNTKEQTIRLNIQRE